MINRYISVFTLPTVTILLRVINFCFYIIGPYSLNFRRDSVFLLSFPFLSDVQVFSLVISAVYCFKYPSGYFFSPFCFLVFVLFILMLPLLLLAAVINRSLLFSKESSCLPLDASMDTSMLASPLSPLLSKSSIYSLEFFTSAVFHWSLSDSKSPHVSRTLSSILAILNNVVVWMASTRPPTSKSSSPFSNPLVTVPNAPITIGKIVTCMFHSFFNSLARSRYLSFFLHFYSFILWSPVKSTILQVLFFFDDYY